MYLSPLKSRWQSQWTQFKSQWMMYRRSLFKNYHYKRPDLSNTSDFTSNSCESLASLIYLDTPSTGEAPSQRKRKRPRIRFVNYLEEDDRPSSRSRRLRKSHPYKYFQEEEDCVLRSLLCTNWAIEVNILPDLTICVFDVSLLSLGHALVRFQNLCLHLGAVKRVNERFLCTRAAKALLLYLHS